MKCDCWDKAYRPVLKLLDEAAGNMYYANSLALIDVGKRILKNLVSAFQMSRILIARRVFDDSNEK
jgi:hypothetical protein